MMERLLCLLGPCLAVITSLHVVMHHHVQKCPQSIEIDACFFNKMVDISILYVIWLSGQVLDKANNHKNTIVHYKNTIVHYKNTIVHYKNTIVHYKNTIVHYKNTIVHYKNTIVHYKNTIVHYKNTIVHYKNTIVHYKNTIVHYKNTIVHSRSVEMRKLCIDIKYYIVCMYSMPYYTYGSTANFLFLEHTVLIYIFKRTEL